MKEAGAYDGAFLTVDLDTWAVEYRRHEAIVRTYFAQQAARTSWPSGRRTPTGSRCASSSVIPFPRCRSRGRTETEPTSRRRGGRSVNNDWAFADMTASNDLLGDREALRARLAGRGLPLLQGPDRPRPDPRRCAATSSRSWPAAAGSPAARGSTTPWRSGMPVREGDEEYFRAYDDVQRLESFHALAHDDDLLAAR